jgi:ABC-type uncharacterized transport system involved in gliding motility auxiliary subunit
MFADQEIPVLETTEDVIDQRTEEDGRVNENDDIKIVIFGDAEFVTDEIFQATGVEDNIILLVNMIEWLSNSDDLLAIRSKNISLRPLEVASEGDKAISKSISIFLVPVITILLGVGYNIVRKKKGSGLS